MFRMIHDIFVNGTETQAAIGRQKNTVSKRCHIMYRERIRERPPFIVGAHIS